MLRLVGTMLRGLWRLFLCKCNECEINGKGADDKSSVPLPFADIFIVGMSARAL